MKITNKKTLTEGWSVGSQTPIDDRLVFDTLVTLADLGTSSVNAYRYYEGMVVSLLEDSSLYMWMESPTGVLTTGFTYPSNIIVNGVNYSGRTFNFVNITSVPVEDSNLGNIYYVSSNGNDSNAVVGSVEKTYQTLTAAKDAAVASGDTNTLVYVFPGEYQEVDLAYQNGSYYFSPGSLVKNLEILTAVWVTEGIIFDCGATKGITSFNVYGDGDFFIYDSTDAIPNWGGAAFWVDNAAFEGKFSFGTCVVEQSVAIYIGNATRTNICGDFIDLQGSGYGITIREAGEHDVSIDRIHTAGAAGIYIREGTAHFSGAIRFKAHQVKHYNGLSAAATAGYALQTNNVTTGGSVVFDVQEIIVERTDSGAIAGFLQRNGSVIFNIGSIETNGTGVLSHSCQAGFFQINIKNIEGGTGGHLVWAFNMAANHDFEVNIERGVSSNATSAIEIATNGTTTANKLKLNGTIESTDASAVTIDLNGNNTSATLITEELTLISAGTTSISNTHSSSKNIKVNGRISSNKPFTAGKIINTVAGSNIIIDSNITE